MLQHVCINVCMALSSLIHTVSGSIDHTVETCGSVLHDNMAVVLSHTVQKLTEAQLRILGLSAQIL